MTAIHETAYAKINLALHVRRRRADGYHELESLFAFAEDGDRIEAETAEALTLAIDGPFAAGLEAGPDNLVLRAAEALRAASGVRLGARLRLIKSLPVASGVGGGSADAAATLRLLARLWDVEETPLLPLAEGLGSDVPACVLSRSVMVRGRGEILEPHEPPGLAGLPILLVNPDVPLATGPVFTAWDQVDRGALDAASLDALLYAGRNDLEPAARSIVPEIGAVLEALKASGSLMARMSGSGATCFALFSEAASRDAAAAALAAQHPGWWIMRTRIRTHE